MKIIVDNVYSTIVDKKDVALVKQYLKAKQKGYQFSRMYKRFGWDGTIYFIDTHGQFLTGFLPLILKQFKEQITDVIDNRKQINKIEDFVFEFDNLKLRDYQCDIVKSTFKLLSINDTQIYWPRGIIDAATNAGKSAIIASIHKSYKTKTILLVHTQELFKQSIEYFSNYFNVGYISSNITEYGDFLICMYKSLYNKLKSDIEVKQKLNEYDCLIVDEAHRASAEDYSSLIKLINSPIRFFVSGTPLSNHDNVSNLKTVGLSGPSIYKLSNSYLINNGFSLKPNIYLYRSTEQGIAFTFRDEYEKKIMFSKQRLEHIINVLKKNKKQTLISFNEIAHGEFIFNELRKHFKNIEMVHGEDILREDKIDMFKNGEINILISSMILKEGINIPNIERIILAHGGKSIITIKQLIGRALRTYKGLSSVDVIDFIDNGKWVFNHSKARISLYESEQFKIIYE